MKHVFATCCLFLAATALQAQDLIPFKIWKEPAYAFGYRDSDNKTVIEPKYQGARPFSEGLAPINIGGRFDESAHEGFGLTRGGKWGYIDEAGNIVIAPKYEVAEAFSEGFAAVRIDGKVGYINRAGNTVIAPKYDDGRAFQDGFARVNVGGRYFEEDDTLIGGQWGVIDAKGNTVIEIKYEHLGPFSEGLAAVAVKDPESTYHLVGFIDKTGREVIRPQFYAWTMSDLPVFEGGEAEIYDKKEQRIFTIDKTGKEILDEDKILGDIHYSLQRGDYAEAVKLATEHANNGFPKVMGLLAYIYYAGYTGQGATPNYAEALRWYKKAAENGEAGSIYMVGVMHYNGEGTARYTQEGIRWVKKAAEKGYEEAIEVLKSVQ